ncbi:hypothetical protein POKO110462_02165 [Pontibacter korlensis]|uniref:Uncharacterized protein n=1 Tax=Pontibacter korlensis TaxID=400092 RepID=A0A0E3ZFS9_9BACT|nr:hypothetical protein PKOR_11990 [Pontibacter korlensis]
MTLYAGGSVRHNQVEVRRIVSEKWGLTPFTNSSYKYYTWIEVPDGDVQSKLVAHGTNCKGRYYVVPIEKLEL